LKRDTETKSQIAVESSEQFSQFQKDKINFQSKGPDLLTILAKMDINSVCLTKGTPLRSKKRSSITLLSIQMR